jgi:hypothetical protein
MIWLIRSASVGWGRRQVRRDVGQRPEQGRGVVVGQRAPHQIHQLTGGFVEIVQRAEVPGEAAQQRGVLPGPVVDRPVGGPPVPDCLYPLVSGGLARRRIG